MLKSVSKKLSAGLAVSAIASVLVPAQFKAMWGGGEETNNPPTSSSSERRELDTYFQIVDFASDIDSCSFRSEAERLQAMRKFEQCASPQSLSNQELKAFTVLNLADCICNHGIGVFENLRLDTFDSAARSVLVAADNWHHRKTSKEKKQEMQDFLARTKDFRSEGAKARERYEREAKAAFENKKLEIIFRASYLDAVQFSSSRMTQAEYQSHIDECDLTRMNSNSLPNAPLAVLIPKVIIDGVDNIPGLASANFSPEIQNLIQEADQLNKYAKTNGIL